MNEVTIYCSWAGPRLHYVLDWLFGERLQVPYKVTLTEPAVKTGVISYGLFTEGCLNIPALPLLFNSGNVPEQWVTGTWDGIPVLGCTGEKADLPFDIFAALFFLLSRQEEYFPHSPDLHGRFPPSASILHRNGWLTRPLADEWVARLRTVLLDRWPLQLPEPAYCFQPTYDIDIAYSHSYKGFARLAGAYLRALARGDMFQISERTRVLKKKQQDPYDSFAWLRQIHERLGYRPIYFVLCSLRTTAYDKNISPMHPAMNRAIKQMARDGNVTIHPSYYANKEKILRREVEVLEEITQKKISESRQHYIRLKLPDTYRMLAAAGITHDYSMGYGSHLGFRAGTGSSFLWFDLESNQVTGLRVHPFCFMDTTAHYEHGYSPERAFAELNAMNNILMQTGSTLVSIFHNFSLGTVREWAGWQQEYERFMTLQAKKKRL
jgi:hypothetical protein